MNSLKQGDIVWISACSLFTAGTVGIFWLTDNYGVHIKRADLQSHKVYVNGSFYWIAAYLCHQVNSIVNE